MIVYQGLPQLKCEIIVTTEEHEPTVIKEFFTEGGRDIDNYDRIVVKDYISFSSSIKIGYQD